MFDMLYLGIVGYSNKPLLRCEYCKVYSEYGRECDGEESTGTLDSGKEKNTVDEKRIKLSADVYEKYFASVKFAEVAGIV